MRSRPDRISDEQLRAVLVDAWGVEVETLRHVPEGGGAHHWAAEADDGQRWFVTVDDLDTKPWFGSAREAVFEALTAAYRAAIDLRRSGATFVVAPIEATTGAPAARIDEQHTVSLFEFVEGDAGRWGAPATGNARREVVRMLATLHASGTHVRGVARRGVEVSGRAHLEDALDTVGQPWDGGPLAEAARRAVAEHETLITRWLAELDAMGALDGADVLTHGEPHPGNLIRTRSGVGLIDWDTVAFARPERDLWMLVGDDDDLVDLYRELTGTALERAVLAAYRLVWALDDVTAFTMQLRREHRRNADSERAVAGLRRIFAGEEPAPYGRPG